MENEIKLTPDQQNALNLLNKDNTGIIVLEGSAGTGKTTLIKEYLAGKGSNIALTAPTHKAVSVLESKNPGSPCSTIHAFLGLKPVLEGAEYIFRPQREWTFVKYLIVDEASMIPTELLFYIEKYHRMYPSCRIVLIGDNKQLNPVGENISPIFQRDFETVSLTTIVRHQNDIIDLSQNLGWLSEGREGTNFTWDFDDNLHKLIESNGSDKAKFITWTNDTVAKMNNYIRQQLYGINPAQFYVGETILLTEPFLQDGEVLYQNNQEVKIESIDQVVIYEYPCYLINGNLPLLYKESIRGYNDFLEELKEAAIHKLITWREYYDFKESFGSYQYNHAITVHRSQGSTYEESFVKITEISRNPNRFEKKRMLYTAITRASKMNYLC